MLVRFLGILLDHHLNWKHHLLALSKKLAGTCGSFFKIKQIMEMRRRGPVYTLIHKTKQLELKKI